jgi:glycosyltransferase involved in cell wall biosynthesis
MRLIVVMNVWNEAKHIAKSIESVIDQADEIRVFDGAYREFPAQKPYSTDGTIEIAKSYPKTRVITANKPYGSQIEKRTRMFEGGQEGDFFFKLDGDEYVINPEIIRNHLNMDVGWCWVLSNLYREPYMTARIFKYQPGLHYAGRHHWLYNGKNQFVTSDQYMNLRFKHQDTPIRIYNDRHTGEEERYSQKMQFLINRTPDEKKYPREDRVYNTPVLRLVPHPKRAPKPRKPSVTLKYCENPMYTFTLMFSRPWAVDKYFDHLKTLIIPPNTEMVTLIDGNDPQFINKVIDKLTQVKDFAGIRYYVTGNSKLPEDSHVILRRERIAANWYTLLTEAKGRIILGNEDDSLPERGAYTKLLETLDSEQADFVQGNIIGRWKANMCPAWHVEEKDGSPVSVKTGEEKKKGTEEIQGCGWYCFAAFADVMRKFPMQTDDLLPLGPDLRFGYNLWKGGYKLLHRWDARVEHFGEKFSLLPGRDETKVFKWERRGDRWHTMTLPAWSGKANRQI